MNATTHQELFGATATITAIGDDEVIVEVTDDDPARINNLDIEFRVYFKRSQYGHWQSTNMFTYRVEADRPHRYQQRPATPNQSSKIYSAIKEICEALPHTFLLTGEVNRRKRNVENAEGKAALAQEEVTSRQGQYTEALNNLSEARRLLDENESPA